MPGIAIIVIVIGVVLIVAGIVRIVSGEDKPQQRDEGHGVDVVYRTPSSHDQRNHR